MAKQPVETSVLFWGDRHIPGRQMVMEQARAIEDSGVVDWVTFPDHIINFIPPSLWKPEVTPLANVFGDPDSMHDAVVMAALAHAAAPSLGLSFGGDPVRKNPADLCQTMWSLAAVTEGRVRFQFGPGEIKNLKPYGHKRSEGLARFEDLLRVSHALWEAEGPIDYVGHHCNLKQAYLGGAKQYRPEIWSMGTGPKQLDLATTFCDGITSSIPAAWHGVDQVKTEVQKLRQTLAEKGRDPDKVGIGSFFYVLVHEDPAVIDRALDNPLIRWMAATIGRVNPTDWRKEGIEPATPEGWAYFNKFVPYETSAEFAAEVLSKTTRKMAERSFTYGNAAEVAAKMKEYADAGLTWVSPIDYTALILDPADAAKSTERMIEVCAGIKGKFINANAHGR